MHGPRRSCRLLLLLVGFLALRPSAKRFSVLRVDVKDEQQLAFLQAAYVNTTQFDFWKEPTVVGDKADIMVEKETQLPQFEAELKDRNFTHRVIIEDVERLINKRRNETVRRRPTHRDPPLNGAHLNFARYHSFAEMIGFLNGLALGFPDRVHVQPIGTTHEGRQIPLIKIGTRSATPKPAIWIDGGIHAREWVSPAVVLYFINQLVTEYDRQPAIRQLVDQLDWYIAPLVNPDGYEFSRSSTDPETRLWRKNRSPLQCTTVSTGVFTPPRTQCCQGVDLNRNFDWYFGQVGSSTDPCSEIYAGTYAFSEPETRAIRDFVTSLGGQLNAFLTFHSYSQILMFPFGHATQTYPADAEDLKSTAQRAAYALQSVYGIKYTVGTGADTLYPASGGSEDWAKGRMGVKYSFLFELRPDESVWDGFLLAENQILPTCRETWEAVKSIAQQTLRFAGVRPFAHSVATVPGASVVRPRECRDLDPLCDYWAKEGACNAWPSMRERCARSCSFCFA
ncbi:ShKT domain-containing protein [Aphelenchoides fujianensis]|nr:ShKT domain-containing protein [Aphelenchoides fujianensis]